MWKVAMGDLRFVVFGVGTASLVGSLEGQHGPRPQIGRRDSSVEPERLVCSIPALEATEE